MDVMGAMRIWPRWAWALWCVGAAVAPGQPIPVRRVLIDFGPADRPCPPPWNHIYEAETGGIVLRDAVSSSGEPTGMRVRQLDGWCGVNLLGCPEGGPFPPGATSDSFYLGDRNDRSARLRIEGLEPHATYALRLYAARWGRAEPRVTEYRVQDRRVTLDAHGNRDREAVLSGLKADPSGRLVLDVAVAEGSTFGYLGAMEVQGPLRDASATVWPLDLGAPPDVTADAFLVADGESGEVLAALDPDTPFEIASTTKIMTALVVLGHGAEGVDVLSEIVEVSPVAAATPGSRANLEPGERLSVDDLLYALLLPSGNDAAVALAEHFGARMPPRETGDVPGLRFVAAMNEKARELGLSETRFLDPHGNSGNRASARDLLRLARTAYSLPAFQRFVSTRERIVPVRRPDGTVVPRRWTNTNLLLGTPGCDGVKTGTTQGAGGCLVTSFRRGDLHRFVVVLGCAPDPARYVDTRNLLRFALTSELKK